MADNQSRAKTNPFPHHNHSSIMMNNNSAPYNSHQQHQHQGGLSLSLSFPQHAADTAPSPILLPLGPFTGYATILNTSRFLTPAQSILDDLFAFVNSHHTHHHEAEEEETSLGSELKSLGERVSDHRWNKSNLMLMLYEVHRRYNLCCDQMKTVVTSFEAVAGLGNAAPFISNAIRIVSVHFTSLKNALLHRIHTQSGCCRDHNEHQQSDSHNHNMKPSSTRFNLNFFLQSPPPPQQRTPQHPVWRSQRVLPDHAVALLKSWLFEHFLHPYPTDAEKQILAQQTGLSRTQVSNWFINARVRVWKPMVEEIHSLESEHNAAASSSPLVLPPPAGSSSSMAPAANIGNKRARISEQEDHGGYSSSDGVSLALGLPRTNVSNNNPSWPFSVNATARPSGGNHGFGGGGNHGFGGGGSNQFHGR